MTVFKKSAALLVGLSILLTFFVPSPARASEPELKGVWVSTVYNLDYPSRAGLSKTQLEQEADEIIENAASLGFNAVFFQARPCADSLFPSDIFPWSAFTSGVQGQAPDGGFDPLGYFTEKCHERGLQLHCWLNPYRITRKAAQSKEEALASLSPDHPAVKHPELTVFHSDGCLYFDPGIPEGRGLILSGIEEVIEKYPVDGIHFDDYFYPSADFEDGETFRLYGQDYETIEDFRRGSVTAFVSSVNEAIKNSGKDISFGVSPFGIWANSDQNPEGSDTVGNQSYYSHYADSLTWVKKELVDYIAPQLYWSVGNREGEFKTLLDWWLNQTRDTKVKLYIGQAAYRMLEADISSPWYGTGELAKQLALMEEGGADGTIMFRYSSIMKHRPLYWFIKSSFSPQTVQAPETFAVTTGHEKYVTEENIYIGGSADSSSPLYINRQEQEIKGGFFGRLCPLKMGLNTIWVENGSRSEKLEIYRVAQRSAHPKTLSSPMPQTAAYSLEKGEDTIGVRAPKGAKVFAFTNAFNTELFDNGTGLFSSASPVEDFEGHVLYSCEKNGLLSLKISRGNRVGSVPKSATVTSDICDIYYTANKSDGAGGFLTKGMTFDIEGWQNGMAYNSLIGYVSCDDLSLNFENYAPVPSLTDIASRDGQVIFNCGAGAAATAAIEGGNIRLTFPKAQKGFLFESPLFTSVTLEEDEGGLSYVITPAAPVHGYDLQTVDEKIILNLLSSSNDTPLVVIDAGHGGGATGALGLKEGLYEKEINLQSALILKEQLEALGIDVLLTREEDTDISLKDRLAYARRVRPDLLISIHSNSAERSVDGNLTSGTEIYIKDNLSRPVSDRIAARLGSAGVSCSIKSGSRLYMCRSTICPSLLLENGYMINPNDMASLTDSARLGEYYAGVAQGIYEYLSNR